MFEHRKDVVRGIISSHGEASRFFVTFLDNHDQHERFFFSAPEAPRRFEDQLTLGISCLFTLQGIPCLYYGTEQGLHGAGNQDTAVREALWGKPNAFDREQLLYRTVQRLARVRRDEPALRYGRQYFRPLSGDGFHFGVSNFPAGVLAFSRILNDRELLVVANSNTASGFTGEVIVDFSLNPVGSTYDVLFTNNTANSGGVAPSLVVEKPVDSVEIREVNGALTTGPARILRVTLQKMELQILGRRT
jgi:glycosidase